MSPCSQLDTEDRGGKQCVKSLQRINCPMCQSKLDNPVSHNTINHPLKCLPCFSFLLYPDWSLKFLLEQTCLSGAAPAALHTALSAEPWGLLGAAPAPAPLLSHKTLTASTAAQRGVRGNAQKFQKYSNTFILLQNTLSKDCRIMFRYYKHTNHTE